MYAIIRASGHQEKVSPGEVIVVNRLKNAVGDQVTFVPLVVSKDDGSVITDHKALADNAKVVGTVREHVKGDKVDIYQYRNKTGYRKQAGHRQPLTVVEISEIQVNGETFTAPPPEEKKPEPKAEKKPAAKKTAKGKAKGAKATKSKKTAKAKAEPKKAAEKPAEKAEESSEEE